MSRSIWSKNFYLNIPLVLLLSFGMIACTKKQDKNTDNNLKDGLTMALPMRFANVSDLVDTASLSVVVELSSNGQVISLPLQDLVLTNTTFTGKVTGVVPGTYRMLMRYYILAKGIKVEIVKTKQQPVTVSSTSASTKFFTEIMNTYTDNDGDGHSNLHEIDKGTEWENISSFPAPDNPVLQVQIQDLNVNLSWRDVGGVESYTVFVADSDLTIDNLDQATAYIGKTSPFVSPVALTTNKLYYFFVQGTNSIGAGDLSQSVSVNPKALVPTEFTITSGNGEATFEWPSVPPAANGIDLYMQNTPGVKKTGSARLNGWMAHRNISSGFVHRSLTNGKPYYFAFTSRNGTFENSAVATEIMIQPKALLNGAPDDVSVHVVGGKIFIEWTQVTDKFYSIYHTPNLAVAPVNEFQDSDFTSPFDVGDNYDISVPHYFSVSVKASVNPPVAESGLSALVGFAPQILLKPPVNLTAKMVEVDLNSNTGTVELRWQSVVGADKYKLYMGPASPIGKDAATRGGSYMVHKDGILRASFDHPNVSGASEFYFRVSAVNAYGESDLSNEAATAPIKADPVTTPVVGGSYTALINSILGGVDNKTPQLNVNVTTIQTNDSPSVQVQSITAGNPPLAARATVQRGTTINVKVSIPLDGGQFLEAVNGKGSSAGTAAYYAAVDPENIRDTFLKWKIVNGLAFSDPADPSNNTYEVPIAQGLFYNGRDHELARVISLKKFNGNVSFYADHFANLQDAVKGDLSNLIETVAIEFSPPAESQLANDPRKDAPYLKFFAFNKNGTRVSSINMDSRGEKFVPEVCVTCHAGNATTYSDTDIANNPPKYPKNGNLGSRFIPIDLDAFEFLESDPDFNRATQESEFRLLNEAIMDAYGGVKTKTVVYDGAASGGTAIKDCVPAAMPIDPCVPGRTSLSQAVYFQEGVVNDVNVTIGSLSHNDLSELSFQLISPAGTVISLVPTGGMSGTTITNAVFDDDGAGAGGIFNGSEPYEQTFLPAVFLNTLDGEDGVGRWQLKILDSTVTAIQPVSPAIIKWSLTLNLIPPAVELIQGWYGGSSLPNRTQNGGFIPRGWSTIQSVLDRNAQPNGARPDYLYQNVIKKSCRVCHLQRGYAGSILDFATWDNFNKDGGPNGDPAKNRRWLHRIEHEVFIEGNMPRAFPTFKQFWLSDQPQILAGFVRPGSLPADSPLFGGTKGPGRPYVHAGGGHNVIVGEVVSLNANAMHYPGNSISYSWTLEKPLGSGTMLSDPGTKNPTITPDMPGEYIASLTIDDGSANPIGNVAIERVFANDTLNPNSFVDIVNNILKPDCGRCHRSGGPSDHTGFLVDREIFDRIDVGNTQNTTVLGIYDMIVNQDRRIDPNDPAKSRLLKKPSTFGGIGHGGGVRDGFDVQGRGNPPPVPGAVQQNYNTIFDWISSRPTGGVPPRK